MGVSRTTRISWNVLQNSKFGRKKKNTCPIYNFGFLFQQILVNLLSPSNYRFHAWVLWNLQKQWKMIPSLPNILYQVYQSYYFVCVMIVSQNKSCHRANKSVFSSKNYCASFLCCRFCFKIYLYPTKSLA